MPRTCLHEKVKCLCCGEEGTAAELFTRRPRGQRSLEGAEQSRQAAKQRRVDVTFQEAADILAGKGEKGKVAYKGFTFSRADLAKSTFAGRGVLGAKLYIKVVLAEKKRLGTGA